jgi:DNA adenine methylase
MIKPILKWVGGKTQIMDKLIAHFPANITNYREIFVGGGSVLLTLLAHRKAGNIAVEKIYAYDLNEALIYVYKNIQDNHLELYNEIQALIDEFNAIEGSNVNRKPASLAEAIESRENYYYWIRSRYNALDKKTITASAMFIFLNKTGWRGLYRVSKNGFNVPYGNYKNPEIINRAHLESIHELFTDDVIFECCDYTTSMNQVIAGDFVYLDPPYAPESATSFVKYNVDGFNIENHLSLFALIRKMTEQKILFSNADVALVRDNFADYTIESILCKRAINSKDPSAKAKEVIIRNY